MRNKILDSIRKPLPPPSKVVAPKRGKGRKYTKKDRKNYKENIDD